MAVRQPVTYGTVSFSIAIVGAWIWVTTHFVTQSAADTTHAALIQVHAEMIEMRETMHLQQEKSIKRAYLEVKIDTTIAELKFIEGADMTAAHLPE